MNGCEMVLSNPLGNGMSAYASGCSSTRTNSWRGTCPSTSSTRRSSDALPRRAVRKIVWAAICSTIGRRSAAKSSSVIWYEAGRLTDATPTITQHGARRMTPRRAARRARLCRWLRRLALRLAREHTARWRRGGAAADRFEAGMVTAAFRFYEELNDFLAPERRGREFVCACARAATVKHMIEALDVPHTEVELVLVNGDSVGFDRLLQDGDRVAVYPKFEALDVTPLLRVREHTLRSLRFVADAHLGGLAQRLRLLGFDTRYHNGFRDDEIERLAH